MNYIEEAYKRATEGDYPGRVFAKRTNSEWLDPLFWQCLGKSEGWTEKAWGSGMICEKCLDFKCGRGKTCGTDYPRSVAWLAIWLGFVRHLAEGKDAESFFQSLLTNQKENE